VQLLTPELDLMRTACVFVEGSVQRVVAKPSVTRVEDSTNEGDVTSRSLRFGAGPLPGEYCSGDSCVRSSPRRRPESIQA
jgi:hypothetical protein